MWIGIGNLYICILLLFHWKRHERSNSNKNTKLIFYAMKRNYSYTITSCLLWMSITCFLSNFLSRLSDITKDSFDWSCTMTNWKYRNGYLVYIKYWNAVTVHFLYIHKTQQKRPPLKSAKFPYNTKSNTGGRLSTLLIYYVINFCAYIQMYCC